MNFPMETSKRLENLHRLLKSLEKNEEEILAALSKDLGRHPRDSFSAEMHPLYREIRFFLRELKRTLSPKRKSLPFLLWPGKARVVWRPKGRVLIIGPFNYPVNLSMIPLVGALAAGNRIVLKPSERTPTVAKVIEKVLHSTFPDGLVKVEQGGKETVTRLLDEKFDHIFFTGSGATGKIIYQKAAKSLTTVTLELGGKCPTVVWKPKSLSLAARKIVWAKFFNGGQTCVAPDYILVPKKESSALIQALKKEIETQFPSDGKNVTEHDHYPPLVDKAHLERATSLLKECEILTGGKVFEGTEKLEPTLVLNPPSKHPLSCDEIFGPILPIYEVETKEEALQWMQAKPSPLSVYLFSSDEDLKSQVYSKIPTGSVVENDALIQAGMPLPFGGIGASGLGRYHGIDSIECFSYKQNHVILSPRFDFSMRTLRLPLKYFKIVLRYLF